MIYLDTNILIYAFDAYHVCFCEHFNCKKLMTFDAGFKIFKGYSKVEIEIL